VQVAAARVYVGGADVEAYVRQSARLHAYATGSLYAALVAWGVACPHAYGGFYLYPDFAHWRERLAERGVHTGMELARHLLEAWGVATLPASEFGERADALRLRLATSHLFEPAGVGDAAAREAALWALLEAADSLPEPTGTGVPAGVRLPALERASARLGEFVASLG
jgi:aspartate aminotransferase